MNIIECYQKLHGDYADAKNRLMMDRLVEKFMLKFPNDPSMHELDDAIAAGDNESAFRAVHTLKGVAANLSFTELQKAASALTEQMRDLQHPADPQLYENVKSAYRNTISAINIYKENM